MSREISVVVPVFNSCATLPDLVGRITASLRAIAADFEIILVDDNSSDGSRDAILRLAEQHTTVHPLLLMRNFGQHSALLAGIREARFAVILTLDDDLQNPPEEIAKLIQKLEEGFDLVYGIPVSPRQDLWRLVASKMTRAALRTIVGAQLASVVSPFRAFRTDLRTAFADYSTPFVSIDVLLAWGTERFATVAVRHDARTRGRSNYSVVKLVAHAMNMMTGFSTWPLRFASIVGFALTFAGVAILFYVVGRYFVAGGSVPGFPFLASIIAIFSGAQLFALGVIGEYLGKIHFRSMNRPPYVIDRRASAGIDKDHSGIKIP
jgi:undecaprenyl-phosphate 4-deoxy-4-formamido-L-arabinose transferase